MNFFNQETLIAQNTIGCEPTIILGYTGGVQDYVLEGGAFTDHIIVALQGGDGGDARVTREDANTCFSPGGQAGAVQASFLVGETGANKLRPGSTLRFIIGKGGDNATVAATLGAGITSAGGGGGSALLYKEAGSTTWTTLIVAGGGGGAFQEAIPVIGCNAIPGGNALTGNTTSGGSSGGTGNEFGGGGGGGATSAGAGVTCVNIGIPPTTQVTYEGQAGGTAGGAGGVSEGCIAFPEWAAGGYGFGGGGAGAAFPGGGGGYQGGNAGNIIDGASTGGTTYWNTAFTYDVQSGTLDPQFEIDADGQVTIFQQRTLQIECPATQTIYLNAAGTGSLAVSPQSGTTFSGESYTATFSKTTFNYDDLGENTVTMSFGGTGSCAVSCTFTVNVLEENPPVITCPADITIECDESSAPANTGSATATDASGAAPTITFVDVTTPGSCPQKSTVNRTWMATDASGNQASCVQVITIDDSTPPTIGTCPPTITIACDAPFDPANTGGFATATDNCDPSPDITYGDIIIGSLTCAQEFTRARQWMVTDACGNQTNCVQNIYIRDNTKPVITCPADITIGCDELIEPANTGTATATDNCGPTGDIVITFSDALSPQTEGYLITRTWTATDPCGNASTCDQIITVGGGCDPAPSGPCQCLNNASVIDLDTGTGGDDGQFAELVAITGPGGVPIANSDLVFEVIEVTGAVDAFASPPVAPAQTAGTPIPIGTEMVYNPVTGHYELPFYHYDAEGYNISVQHMTSPGVGGQILSISNVCAYPNPVFAPALQDLYCPNADAFTLSGSDTNGLGSDEVSFTIDGNPTTNITPSDLSIGDHLVVMTWDGAAGVNNGPGTIANPNYSGCTQSVQKTIEINDTTPPVLTCPASLTIQCGSDDSPVTLGMATATDNCTPNLMPGFSDAFAQDGSNNPNTGILTRTWSVQDDYSNAATPCQQTITIIDTKKPVLYCNNIDVSADLEPGACDVLVELIVPEVEEACGLAKLQWRYRQIDENGNNLLPWSAWTSATTASALFEEGFYKIQWKATDLSQNRKRCITYLTVYDPDGLPCPWANNHIGCDGDSSYDYDTETFTLNSENCHNPITNTDDEYSFVSQEICGNATIIAEITGLWGNSNGFAGISMREDNSVGSKMATLLFNGSSVHRKEVRSSTDGSVTSQQSSAFNRRWLKLVRVGNSFRGYASSNGSSWFLKFSHTIAMNSCIEVGLVLNGYTASSDVQATFANVSIIGANNASTFEAGSPQLNVLDDPIQGFSVYPNPSNGLFQIDLVDYLDDAGVLEILNVDGKVIHTTNAIEQINQVDLSHQPGGIYLVRLKLTNGTERVKRILLQD